MNEYFELHKALSEAEVEYQQKFDAMASFEKKQLMPNSITDIEQALEEWDRLSAEERAAYEKREAARKAYEDCLRRQAKHS